MGLIDVMIPEFQKVYNCLDIQIIERGESFYQNRMIQVVKEFEDKGETQSMTLFWLYYDCILLILWLYSADIMILFWLYPSLIFLQFIL